MLKKFLFTLCIVWMAFILYTFLFAATDYTATAVSWWYLEEAAGNPRLDGSGVNNNDLIEHGTGGIARSADKQQGSWSADFELGDADYLDIADGVQNGLDITGDLTMVFWMKAETLTSGSHYLQIKFQSDTHDSYYIRHSSGTLNFNIGDGIGSQALSGGAALNTGTWYHIACVFDAGDDMHIYVNGSTASPGNTAATALTEVDDNTGAFGLSYSVGYVYDGLMDEFAIFDTALSSADINSIMDYRLDGSADVAEENAIFFGINFLACLFLVTLLRRSK